MNIDANAVVENGVTILSLISNVLTVDLNLRIQAFFLRFTLEFKNKFSFNENVLA